ncbi:MAG: methylated-DNA--[protein]-cysteine S-methyltransferase [Candidatus Binataceae bacterium]|jgi:O-6-methylguanine DNA methyltransferase
MSSERDTEQLLLELDGEAEDDPGLDAIVAEGRRRFDKAIARERRPVARVGVIDSPVGHLFVADGPRGILAIHFMDGKGLDPLAAMRGKFDIVEDQAAAERIGDEIRRFIAGDRTALKHDIDLSLVESDFKRRALTKLCKVPLGSVVTYQGLASAIGAPDGQRAIGNAMGSNPVPIYVPCHRVIKSDLSIGNYGGGVERKLKLLRAEGFAVGTDLRVPARAVMGHQRTHIYCRPQCSAAQRADMGRCYIFADSERARSAGLRACKLCHPA